MSLYDEMNRRYQGASFAKAEQEGRVGSWIFWKVVTRILLFPAMVMWRWTGERTHGFLAHVIQFAFFAFLAYSIPIAIVIMVVQSIFGGGAR